VAPTRPGMRADARRNYERLLSEAHTVFTEQGTEAALEDIARRAGVGIGTLYRHFPTRQALLEALLHQRFAALQARGEQLHEQAPRSALAAWLRELLTHVTTYRGLPAEVMATASGSGTDLGAACQAAQDAGAALLSRAQAAGVVRHEVTAEELFLMAGAIAWAAEQAPAPERAEALLGLLLGGLWTRGDE
jgi:AcrR family transcriptional regulator